MGKGFLASVGLLEAARGVKGAFPRSLRRNMATIRALEKEKETMVATIRALEKEKETMVATIRALEREKESSEWSFKTRLRYYEGDAERYTGRDTRLPGIVFNALPKSAGVYIARTLAQSLDIEYREIGLAHGFFPHYFLIPRELERVKQGNMARHEHFDAHPVNLEVLSRCTDRLVVQLRDPRQATLSWMHHAESLHREHPSGFDYTMHFPFPAGYDGWPFARRLDWHIDTQLVSSVEWISGWAAALDKGGKVRVLFTRYEDFVRDERSFLRRVLDFYGIPERAFAYSPAEKTASNNFRLGRTDEWVNVFTDAQKARSLKIIGSDLLRRFGWADGASSERGTR